MVTRPTPSTADSLATSADAPAPPADDVASPGEGLQEPTPKELVQAEVRQLLLRDLARHFRYPPLARRAGWQGTVLLAVTLAPDGALTDVRIRRSSGHAVLDRAAADTLERIGRLTTARPWLQGRHLELLLPVIYRLTE